MTDQFAPIVMREADLEFVFSREHKIEEICLAFGIDRWQISTAPNRLLGAYINERGEAV